MPVEMPRTNLGNTDMQVSRLAFGTYRLLKKLDEPSAMALLGHAYHEGGVNFFDTSNNYGPTEDFLGKALHKGVLPRKKVIIATKTGQPGSKEEAREFAKSGTLYDTSAQRIRLQVEVSLRTMGIGIIDLYQVHVYDPNVDPFEIADVMNELIEDSKIRHWGLSNYNRPELVSAIVEASAREGLVGPVSLQNTYNILDRRVKDSIQNAQDLGMSVLAWSPLKEGALTERLFQQIPDIEYVLGLPPKEQSKYTEEFLALRRQDLPIRKKLLPLKKLAADLGVNVQQLAIAWLMHQTGVIPILGAYKQEHFDDLVQAVGLRLDDEALALIDEVVASAYSAD